MNKQDIKNRIIQIEKNLEAGNAALIKAEIIGNEKLIKLLLRKNYKQVQFRNRLLREGEEYYGTL
jgi:hypothetical protein